MKLLILLLPVLTLPLVCETAYSEAPAVLTYQGRLKESEQPANGSRTVEIKICPALTGSGCVSAGPQAVGVANGLFKSTFTVPAGVSLATGEWYLELSVEGDTFSPREKLTSSPYALYSTTAAYANSLTASPGAGGISVSTSLFVTNGNAGIGTASPGARLDVRGTDTQAYNLAAGTSTVYSMVVSTNGNVGIGVANPSAKLHVADSADSSQAFIRATNFNPVSYDQWPSFDGTSPYRLQYALWVGWDNDQRAWKYYRDTSNTRGLTDPGDPATWSVNGTSIGYFDGKLEDLPSGTHINNKYNPKMPAYKCLKSGGTACDDIQVKVGTYWIDKYPVRVIDLGTGYNGTTLIDDTFGGNSGNGQSTSPFWLALSQKKGPASTGMTWFEAQQCCINAGKRIASNAEWQGAAAGTTNSTGNGQTDGRDWSVSVPTTEISRYGAVGMAGNIWEWVGDWGQYGSLLSTQTWTDDFEVEWDSATSAYNDDHVWNVADRAFSTLPNTGWSTGLPVALLRGGHWSNGAEAGVFAISADDAPLRYATFSGTRCAKP
ncbi:MAG: hypothetical protein NTX59_05800 [Elusimicrobia bacterium]|nr:hypothetical protein [Elusimicrobiota bacterium]